MAEGASVSRLAGALAEELARDVGCIYEHPRVRPIRWTSSCNMVQALIDNRGPIGVGQDGRGRGGGIPV